ncbi:hypothetical protein Tco_0645970 [Tanacetum coccineum]
MMERELGEGYSFTKKKCFVCGSLSHLIKDCDYHEKKMAREAELKKQRVFITGNGVAKPVWTNANRVNHANQFVPRSVQLNAGRPNINSVRPNINTGRPNINSVRPNINTGRTNVNFVRPNINTGRTNVNSVRPRVNTGSSNVNTVRSRQPIPTRISNSFSPKRPQVIIHSRTWKILRHGGKGYCHLIRANQRDSVFVNLGAMLHNISRDDLVDLYKIMLQKTTAYGPEKDLESAFAENLRIMFNPPQSEDTLWSLPMHIPIVKWRYYDSCNVHCLNLHNTTSIYMLAERSYPLSEEVCRAC